MNQIQGYTLNKRKIENYCVSTDSIIKDVIKVLNDLPGKIVIVTDTNNVVVGTITDGDIRRALLDGKFMSSLAQEVMNVKFIFLNECYTKKQAYDLFLKHSIKQIPVLDDNKTLVTIVFSNEIKTKNQRKENYVIIMAGGKGKRLGKITTKCPKPMLLVNNKPIIEHIIDRMRLFGFSKYLIAVNYLKERVKSYLGNGQDKGINIKYIEEEKFLGTAGSLSLLELNTDLPVIVLNGDVLSLVNFDELLNYFRLSESYATVCAREHSTKIPYGVIQTNENNVTGILEKPDHSCYVNAGIYVFNPKFQNFLDHGIHCDMPELINKLIGANCKVNYFPIHEYWLDVGLPETLMKANDEWDN